MVSQNLPPLADAADVAELLGKTADELSAEEIAKIPGQLKVASTIVRAFCHRDFTLTTERIRLRPQGSKVILPRKPVVDVWEVKTIQSFGTQEFSTPMVLWRWAAGNEIYLGDSALIINGPSFDLGSEQTWVEVVYQHGYAEVPDDVRLVVAGVVVRNLSVPLGGVIDLQTVGPYTTRYASYAAAGPLSLGPGDREVLNRYRSNTSGTIELRAQ